MPCPEKFKETMEKSGIDQAVAARVNAGFEALVGSSPKHEKAAYFQRAMDILDECADPAAVRALLAENACCKSGTREKNAKAFRKANAALSLPEKLEKIKDVPHMGTPVLNEDGTITVHAVYYTKGDGYLCGCANFNGLKRRRVSRTYCFCCAGHFQYHYEIMLGVKLEPVEIVSSPLDTDGREPCVMRFRVV